MVRDILEIGFGGKGAEVAVWGWDVGFVGGVIWVEWGLEWMLSLQLHYEAVTHNDYDIVFTSIHHRRGVISYFTQFGNGYHLLVTRSSAPGTLLEDEGPSSGKGEDD